MLYPLSYEGGDCDGCYVATSSILGPRSLVRRRVHLALRGSCPRARCTSCPRPSIARRCEHRGDAVTSPTAPSPSAPAGPLELLKSRSYVGLLVLGAVVGIVVATAAYFFLKGVAEAQEYLFTNLPDDLGFDGAPVWWPLPILALGGLVVGLTIRHLPGTGGHAPAEGFKPSGASPSGRASRHHHRGLRHPQLRGGARARSSAHRHRQRHGRPGGAPGPPRCSATGDRGDRGRRQLRGDQHPPRLAAHRSLPAHGGVRARGRVLGVVLVPGLFAAGIGWLIITD